MSDYPRLEYYVRRLSAGDSPFGFAEAGIVRVNDEVHRQRLKRDGYRFSADHRPYDAVEPNPLDGTRLWDNS